MRQSLKRGFIRLGIVVISLWWLGLFALTTFQYQNYQKSMLVEVTRYEPLVSSAYLYRYQESLRKKLMGKEIDLGEIKGKRIDPRLEAIFEADARKMANERDKALEIIPKRKPPFTDDYVDEISRTARLPMQVVKEHPNKAETLYRVTELRRQMLINPWVRKQVENRKPTERHIVVSVFLLFAFVIPAFLFLAGAAAFYVIRWVVHGFNGWCRLGVLESGLALQQMHDCKS